MRRRSRSGRQRYACSGARGLLAAVAAALALVPSVSLAQSGSGTADRPRWFVDVNVGGAEASLARATVFSSRFVVFDETASTRVTYPRPATNLSLLLDVSGGVMLTPYLGVGAGLSRLTYKDPASFEATIPHPLFLSVPATAAAETGRSLRRRETALHAIVTLVPVRTRLVEVRLFGGPSLFWYAAEMIAQAVYDQAFDAVSPEQTITITGFTSDTMRDRTFGFHLGGDVTYYIRPRFGVGAGLRYSRAIATLQNEPLSRLPQDVRIGGRLGFVGVRIRFGS
jgi:opacity protein-like surface antigen